MASNDKVIVTVNENFHKPDTAWNKMHKTIPQKQLQPLPLNTPIYPDKVRFVCISDTHCHTNEMIHEIPSGDVLIHAGDFSRSGRPHEIQEFNLFLKSLNDKFKYKVVIAGNHEVTFCDKPGKRLKRLLDELNVPESKKNEVCKHALKHCIYLEDSGIEIFGIKIYGSPWVPIHSMGFNVERGAALLDIWNKIPDDTDILVTHGPPLGFGDLTAARNHVGCCELLSTIRERVKPKFNIFGHVHEGHGIWTDTVTTYINASICNKHYHPINAPIIFDYPLPEGFTK